MIYRMSYLRLHNPACKSDITESDTLKFLSHKKLIRQVFDDYIALIHDKSHESVISLLV
jgi:hypothetical protein